MYKLRYRNAVSKVEVSFESYVDLVYFVSDNKINDNDFVSLTINDKEIVGLDSLFNEVKSQIEEMKEAENEDELPDDYDDDHYDDWDNDGWCDTEDEISSQEEETMAAESNEERRCECAEQGWNFLPEIEEIFNSIENL